MKKNTEFFGWGDNTFGQLGLGHHSASSYKLPQIYTFKTEISSISCGEYHSLCLSSSGFVYSIGSNLDGRLGLGSLEVTYSSSPCLVKALSRIGKVSCGSSHSLVVALTGEVYTWGLGKYGNLGTGESESLAAPWKIPFSDKLTCISVSCGDKHSGIIMSNGKKSDLYVAGDGSKGQLGSGKFKNFKVFTKVMENILEVACGYEHTAMINTEYKLLTTGSNSEGQLGLNGGNICIPTMVDIEEVIKVAASNITTVVSTNGHLYVWGKGINFPRKMGENIIFGEISAGNGFGIFVDSEKNVYAWGDDNGELAGESGNVGKIVKIRSLAGRNMEKVVCGHNFCMAIGNSQGKLKENVKNRRFSQDIDQTRLCKTYRMHKSSRKSGEFENTLQENKKPNENLLKEANEYEKLRFLLEKQTDQNKKLEKAAESSKILIENLYSELSEYKTQIKSAYTHTQSALEHKNSELQRTIDTFSADLSHLTKENHQLKQKLSEIPTFLSKIQILEENLQNFTLQKSEILSKIEVLQCENDSLRIKNSDFESKNIKLSRQLEENISNHVKDYKEKTLTRLNHSISPSKSSPVHKKPQIQAITPTKEDIKQKIISLQQNRARIEARMKEIDNE